MLRRPLLLLLPLALAASAPAPSGAAAERGPWREGSERPRVENRLPEEPVAPTPAEPRAVRLDPPARRPAAGGLLTARFRDGIDETERARVVAALGAAWRPSPISPFGRVVVPAGGNAAAVLAALAAHPAVAWAEPDAPCYAASRRARTAAVTFNDPLLPRQWMWERIGLLEALDRNGRRGQGVIVAVIDTGVAFGNGARYPERRGVDLDGTAFVPGWDFVDDDPLPYDEGSAVDESRPFTSNRFGHGTFAASQIAATAGNGVAGIGIAPRAAILPLRVLDVTGSGLFSDVAEAIDFAVQAGARVINLSLGGPDGTQALREAVSRAHAAGALLVAASGNEAEVEAPPEDVAFPARYPEVIAVGATDIEGNLATYSNRGPSIELVAPAGDSFEEFPGGRLDAALATSFLHDPRTGETAYGAFWATGTSFAAPQVSGVAALLLSLGVDSPEGLRIMLRDTAEDLLPRGFDLESGHGELDALEAHRGVGISR